MLPKRSSGFLEESPELTASGVLGLGAPWGPHGGSCSSDTCQPPAPAFLAGQMRGLVSLLGVGHSEGSRENHLCTQLYPHLSVGSVLLPELSVQSRPPFSVSHQACSQQAGHHGATGSCFPGSRRCACNPGQEAVAAAGGLPPPTPEAILHAPGWRCPDASHPVSLPRAHPRAYPMARPALPAGPGAGRGTGSPAGLTASGVSGGVSGSRPFLGVSGVHSQGNAGAAGDRWRWAVRLQAPHKGGGLEGQPHRAHFCGWEAGAWAASAFRQESALWAQPALNHPGRHKALPSPGGQQAPANMHFTFPH